MADGIRATPYRYASAGTANDIIGGLLGYLRDPRRTQQMQGLAGLLESTGIPKTVERLAYGEPLTNLQQANVPTLRPETADALMTLLPNLPMAGKAIQATKGLPVGMSIKDVSKFDVVKRDASDIFGSGSQRIKYIDPKSGGMIDVLQRPDGTASVLGLEVPEAMRGQGIGQSLQSQVMQDFPEMMGQVSSRAAAKTAYRLGRRPPNAPDATLDDVYRVMDENSSVNLVSPEMQKRFMPELSQSGLLSTPEEKPIQSLLDTSYRMTHTAPNREFGATLDDLTGGGQMYPADVYSPKGYQYYGTGNSFDKKAFDIANRFKGKPDATVEIYRAVPKGVSDEINPGDWVTLTKDYAEDHGQGPLKGDYKIIKKKVKASDIFTNADSIHEWGYDPQ
jgi:hypothetical protein